MELIASVLHPHPGRLFGGVSPPQCAFTLWALNPILSSLTTENNFDFTIGAGQHVKIVCKDQTICVLYKDG